MNRDLEKQNIYLPYFLICIPFVYLSFMLPIYSKNLGMDSVQIGGLYSVFTLIAILIRPLLGKVGDTVGRKVLLIGSVIMYIVSFYFYSISSDMKIFYVARILQSIAAPMFSISISCFIVDYSKEDLGKRTGKLEATSSQAGIIGVLLGIYTLNYFTSLMFLL